MKGITQSLVSLVVFCCVAASTGYCQDLVTEKSIKPKSGSSGLKESFAIGNERGDITLYMLDQVYPVDPGVIYGIRYDKEFQEKGEMKAERPKGFGDLVGYSHAGKYEYLYLTKRSAKKLAVVTVDSENNTMSVKRVSCPWAKHYYLEAINRDGKLIVLAVERGSSILHLYTYSGESYEEQVFNFNKYKFSSTGPSFLTAHGAIHQNEKLKLDRVVRINQNLPRSIDAVSNPYKLYSFDNKLLLTFNNDPGWTIILSIDLTTNQADFKAVSVGDMACEEGLPGSSNSFVYDGNLYLIHFCRDKLDFKILDLETDAVVQRYTTARDEDISFRNTPIFQEGEQYVWLVPVNGDKELHKTKQLLRKAIYASAGISVYQRGNDLEITMGSYRVPTSTVVVPSPVDPIGHVQYTPSRAVYFKGLFDHQTLEHRQGPVEGNVLDRIGTWKEETKLEQVMKAETIFRIGNTFYFGYYLDSEKVYRIHAFEE